MNKRTKFPYNLCTLPECITENRVSYKQGQYSLGIGLTEKCNFSCPFCFYHDASSVGATEPKEMPIKRLKEILENCKKFSNINFSLEGEPFCYTRIFDALDLAMLHSDSISICSNASLLNSEKIFNLQSYKFLVFSLSIETADKEEYSIFRKGGNLNTFIHNASSLREKLGRCVVFNTVIFQNNLQSLEKLPKLASQIGIDAIGLMQLRENKLSRTNKIRPAKTHDLINCLLRISENAYKNSVNLLIDAHFANKTVMDWVDKNKGNTIIITGNRDSGVCDLPWKYTSILASGKLFPCCGDFQPIACDKLTFNGIYNHNYLQRLRSALSTHHSLPRPCKICRYL